MANNRIAQGLSSSFVLNHYQLIVVISLLLFFVFFFSHFVVARFCCWLSCIRFAAAVAAAVSTSDIALLLVRKHIQLSEQQRMRACMCAFDRANKRPSPVRALSHTHTHTTTTTTQNNIIFFPNKNVHNAIN